MLDKKGNTVLAAGISTNDLVYSYPLDDGEFIVGFKSWTNGSVIQLLNFQLIIMRDIEAEALQEV